MRSAPLAQKLKVVSESHWFSYRFIILSRVIVINACLHTYALDSSIQFYSRMSKITSKIFTNLTSTITILKLYPQSQVLKWAPFLQTDRNWRFIDMNYFLGSWDFFLSTSGVCPLWLLTFLLLLSLLWFIAEPWEATSSEYCEESV